MSRDTDTVLTAYVVESQTTITLGHLCRSCGVHAEWVQQLVAEGVLEPAAIGERERWAFSADSVPRVHTALRLQRDLGLNVSGVALALELMDEIRTLRRQLDAYQER